MICTELQEAMQLYRDEDVISYPENLPEGYIRVKNTLLEIEDFI